MTSPRRHSVYGHTIEMLERMDEVGLDHRWCAHPRMYPGCPACADRFMRQHGIVLTRWNPEAFARASPDLSSVAGADTDTR